MKKKHFGIFVAFSVAAFWACSVETPSDRLVARVGGIDIYQSDVDFLRRTSPKPYAEPDQKSAALENVIESRLVFQEAENLVGKDNPKIQKRMSELEDRFLAQVYTEYFIGQNLGFSDEALQKFFNAEKASFAAESCFEIGECWTKVADRLYLQENADSLHRFIQKKLELQNVSEVNVAYVTTSDSAVAKKVEEDLNSRKVALSAIQGLEQKTFRSDSKEGVMKSEALRGVLFGKDSLPVGAVRRLQDGAEFFVVKMLLRRAPDVIPEEGRDSVLRARFLNEIRDAMNSDMDSLLRKRYNFRLEPIDYPEVKTYYAEHKEEFDGAPLEVVAGQIEMKLAGQDELPLDSAYVLSTIDGKPLVTEKDAQMLKDEMPARYKREYPRRRRAMMLSTWKLKAIAAKEAGLDQSALFKDLKENIRISFYRKAFSDSLAQNGFFSPQDSLRDLYGRIGAALFPNVPFENVRGELGIFRQTPDREFLYRYYRSQAGAPQALDLDSVKIRVFLSAAKNFSQGWFERYRRDLLTKYPVTVVDSAYLPHRNLFSTAELVVLADSFYQARNLTSAWVTWQRIHALAADENDSLFAKSILESAKIEAEREKFSDAEKDYAAYCALWPNSPFAEKALFSRAFILRENVKNDSLAKTLFQEFLQKYPQSEMKGDVEWLLRDIESGGKLTEELNEKISKQENSLN